MAALVEVLPIDHGVQSEIDSRSQTVNKCETNDGLVVDTSLSRTKLDKTKQLIRQYSL